MLRRIIVLTLILILTCLCFAEDGTGVRSTIPEDLRRPQRGESPRYPVDTAIGVLDRGEIPNGAYRFALEVLAAFIADSRNARVLSAANSVSREALFSSLEKIKPRKFRLGSGREEADGAISFLVRFMGREQGIIGELYIRTGELRSSGEQSFEAPETTAVPEGETSLWQFDDLILEDPLSLDEKQEGPFFDLPPYERFF
jgi:hypothetical protein